MDLRLPRSKALCCCTCAGQEGSHLSARPSVKIARAEVEILRVTILSEIALAKRGATFEGYVLGEAVDRGNAWPVGNRAHDRATRNREGYRCVVTIAARRTLKRRWQREVHDASTGGDCAPADSARVTRSAASTSSCIVLQAGDVNVTPVRLEEFGCPLHVTVGRLREELKDGSLSVKDRDDGFAVQADRGDAEHLLRKDMSESDNGPFHCPQAIAVVRAASRAPTEFRVGVDTTSSCRGA